MRFVGEPNIIDAGVLQIGQFCEPFIVGPYCSRSRELLLPIYATDLVLSFSPALLSGDTSIEGGLLNSSVSSDQR